jgi:dipeptidyl aminopeptidase/acylaminoacyl peptidase
MSVTVERRGMFVASLDRPGSPRWLFAADSNVALLGAHDLVVARDRTLIAQPIDPARLTIAGEARPLAQDLAFQESRRAGVFGASSAGMLAWWAHPSPRVQLTWRDRAGAIVDTQEIDGTIYNLALAPDNRRLALERIDPRVGTDDIWLLDRGRASLSRLTADLANDTDPVWAPDSQSLVFASNRAGGYRLYRQRIDRNEPPDRLTDDDTPTFAEDWSRVHGDLIVVQGRDGERQLRRLALPDAAVRSSDDEPARARVTTLVEGPYLKDEPHESPDGRFVAYHARDSGRAEVYVLALDGSSQRWQVSIDGGVQARWSTRGDELFFLGLDGVLQVSSRAAAAGWRRPQPLFQTGLRPHLTLEQYAVSRDGRQFVFALPVVDPAGPVTVSLHAAGPEAWRP